MTTPLLSILIASGSISSLAFLSAGLLSLFPQWLKTMVPKLVALAAGTMLSTAFLHLLPESVELLPAKTALTLTLFSFVSFLIIERLFRWHHCHDQHDDHHRSVGYLNLLGDGFHNFIDGLVIAAAFSADITLGIYTTIAVAAHELPQEIGDFGILLHAGFSRRSALLANFGVALTVVTGALAGVLLANSLSFLNAYLLPIAAGSFLYIATVDLVPEIHRQRRGWEAFSLIVMFLIGLSIMPVTEIALQKAGIAEAHSHSVEAHDESELHMDDHFADDDHGHPADDHSLVE